MDGGGGGIGAGERGDEDSGGEEDADGEFFGKAAGGVVAEKRLGMDQEHPGGQERGEKGVEVEGAGVDAVEESCEGDGAEADDGDEGGAVSVVEAVAGFEFGGERGEIPRGESLRVERREAGCRGRRASSRRSAA